VGGGLNPTAFIQLLHVCRFVASGVKRFIQKLKLAPDQNIIFLFLFQQKYKLLPATTVFCWLACCWQKYIQAGPSMMWFFYACCRGSMRRFLKFQHG
jgi:hypothetical protein